MAFFGDNGIYILEDGNIRTILDQNILADASPEFANLESFQFLSLDNDGSVVFIGSDRNFLQQGIYKVKGDTITTIADRNTPIPDGTGNFSEFFLPSLDNGVVAFMGFGSNNQRGIYTAIEGRLKTVADKNTPIPNGVGNFIGFSDSIQGLSLDNGAVAFVGSGENNQEGIYTNLGGKLTNVVARGDTLLGQTVGGFQLSQNGLSANSLAFLAGLGIYRADAVFDEPSDPVSVPETEGFLGLLAIGFIGVMAKRRVNMST